MTKLTRIAMTAPLATALAGTLSAATPDQVGTWTGSMKTITTNVSGSKTKAKAEMIVEIGADNSTTVTIGGTVHVTPTAGYTDTDGSFLFASNGPPPIIGIAAVSFKGTSMKGVATAASILPGPPQVLVSTSESKIKLKKN